MKSEFLLVAMAAGVAFGATPAGFDAQCGKQLWVTYRSFNKELKRAGQFGAMGITNRCFFAANTINSGGAPYCEYPPSGRTSRNTTGRRLMRRRATSRRRARTRLFGLSD